MEFFWPSLIPSFSINDSLTILLYFFYYIHSSISRKYIYSYTTCLIWVFLACVCNIFMLSWRFYFYFHRKSYNWENFLEMLFFPIIYFLYPFKRISDPKSFRVSILCAIFVYFCLVFLYSTSYIVFIEKQLLIICIYFIFSLKSVKFITSIFSFQFQVEELPVNDVIASNLVFQAWPKKWIGSKSVIQQPKEGAIIVGGYLQGGPHEDGPQQQDVLLGVRACVFFYQNTW